LTTVYWTAKARFSEAFGWLEAKGQSRQPKSIVQFFRESPLLDPWEV
jgi:hypothetical protein